MYIPPFHARVFLVHESAYTHTRAYTDDTHTYTHTYGRTCARDIRGYQSYAKLQTETAPLSLSLSNPLPPIPISRGPNLHTYDVTHDPL